MADFLELIEPVARSLLGETNKSLSTSTELRFGTHGSMTVKIGGARRGTWYNHELNIGGGTIDLVKAQLGCGDKEAFDWLRREFGDLAGAPERSTGDRKIVATYPYVDETGATLFEVVRHEPKEFRQRRPDGNGFVWNVKGVRQVPYRLPELIEAISLSHPVFIVEGEKDVDALASLNFPATCNAGGAGKWRREFASFFEGADVILLPDNDAAGRDHMGKVARALEGTAARIRELDLPDLPRKGDVSDWLAAGGTPEALLALIDGAQDWKAKPVTRLPAIWYGDEDSVAPLSWLVKGLFVNGGLSALYGQPGTSKSFLALDLALHIAHGRDWFNRRVAAGGVVYVTGEGASGMLSRMKAWRKEKGGQPRAPFVLIPQSVNLYDSDDGAEALIDDVRQHAKTMDCAPRLVVLDTLSRMIGSGDEDRAADINRIIQRAERIQRETGAHVLIVHHSGKDSSRGARGSNNIQGATETLVKLEKYESGLVEATVEKVKDGGNVDPFKYTLAQSILGEDANGDDITSCVIVASDASPGIERKGPRLTDSDKIALDALREAVLDYGEPSPGVSQIPSSIHRVVKIESWRAIAYDKGVSEVDTPEARKKAFQRIRERLQARAKIGVWREFVWLAE